ncbi:MAG TPA: tryptophan--tRNA ligase [Rhodospirillales bacterium]|nr:tryptophan--tRNA ligase [Rhodospirillales bacterium]
MARIFSGIQPTGNLQLGNYLGALKNWVKLQHDYECIYCVVDLHAITVWQEPKDLASNTREVTAGLIASGLDPKTNIIFNQSQVSQHSELAWIFSCVSRLGWLKRMTQFKEKAGKDQESASVGLYSYPNLMAADILIYKATHVPVGEDQKQHLELTRDIAHKFNNDFKVDFFPLPEPLILGNATRVMSLRDGTKKMSKSDPSESSRINMTDGPDEIARKIRKAKTDPDVLPADPKGLENRPEAANLFAVFSALSDKSVEEVCKRFEGAQFSKFKEDLTELAIEVLGPISMEMAKLVADPGYLDEVLADGSERARTIARPILDEVYDIVGLLRPKR